MEGGGERRRGRANEKNDGIGGFPLPVDERSLLLLPPSSPFLVFSRFFTFPSSV